jgi:hypothetical protein
MGVEASGNKCGATIGIGAGGLFCFLGLCPSFERRRKNQDRAGRHDNILWGWSGGSLACYIVAGRTFQAGGLRTTALFAGRGGDGDDVWHTHSVMGGAFAEGEGSDFIGVRFHVLEKGWEPGKIHRF